MGSGDLGRAQLAPVTVGQRIPHRPLIASRASLSAGAWVAAAMLSIIIAVVAGPILFSHDWAVDGAYNLAASRWFAHGRDVYAEGRYLYPPLALLVTYPATWLDQGLVLGLYAAAKVLLVAAAALALTRGHGTAQRALVVVGAIAFLPVLHDVALGNTNVLIAAALAFVITGPDSWRRGLVLGVVLAVVPKPWILPLMAWVLVARPRAFTGAAVTAGGLTALAVLITGAAAYADWAGAVLGAGRYFTGGFNLGLSAASPALAAICGLAAATLAMVTLARDRDLGLAALAGAAVLAAPYLGLYGGLPLLLAIAPLARRAPLATAALACAATAAAVFALPFLAMAVTGQAFVLTFRTSDARLSLARRRVLIPDQT